MIQFTMKNFKKATAFTAGVIATIVLGMAPSMEVQAQDLGFTQYNAIPTALNPAFAGSLDKTRLTSVYRNQWANMPGSYVGWHVGHDWFNRNLNSGFGILFSQEEAGAGGLNTTRFAAQYAYEVPLGNGWRLRPALQIGFGNRSLDMHQLTFSDQIIRGGGVSTIEDRPSIAQNYVDFGTGLLLMGQYTWLGCSFDHLNTPDESLNPHFVDPMDVRASVHGGFRMPIIDRIRNAQYGDLVVAFNYLNQNQFNQMDVGVYYDTKPLSIGLWYRGLPFGHTIEGGKDVDAVSILLGYGTEDWKIGYSYDMTLNTLGLATTGGSHEIVMSYTWQTDRRNRPQMPRYVPCPTF